MSEPVIAPDYVALANTLSYGACFEVDMLGPVPFGSPNGRRIFLQISAIVVPTAADAMDAAWDHVRRACEAYSYPFDSDEWDCVDLRRLNCN